MFWAVWNFNNVIKKIEIRFGGRDHKGVWKERTKQISKLILKLFWGKKNTTSHRFLFTVEA